MTKQFMVRVDVQFVGRWHFMVDVDRLVRAYDAARGDLIAESTHAGYWVGHLASSPLATATALSALSLVERHAHQSTAGLPDEQQAELSRLICRGLRWLATVQNPDGGWGDTERSVSNIAATYSALAAFRLTGVPAGFDSLLERADAYVRSAGGLVALRKRYQDDRGALASVLANCALAGLVAWREVPALAFELACVPDDWFRALRRAPLGDELPTLVAVGLTTYHHRRPINPLARAARAAAWASSFAALARSQPACGGFGGSIVETSYVVMCLASLDETSHPLVERGVKFLQDAVRSNGSWPSSPDRAVANTTGAILALAAGGEPVSQLDGLDWLLAAQRRDPHRGTLTGWGATDLDGASSTTDDTAAALQALAVWREGEPSAPLRTAGDAAAAWLLSMQQRDGGFALLAAGQSQAADDQTAPDVAARALRALRAWSHHGAPSPAGDDHPLVAFPRLAAAESPTVGQPAPQATHFDAATLHGFVYLESRQQADGHWRPRRHGNQYRPDQTNPVYGTSQVLLAYRDFDKLDATPAQRGIAWLLANQNADGGWGGRVPAARPRRGELTSSIEETALAVSALGAWSDRAPIAAALDAALAWLVVAVEEQRHRTPSPIGIDLAGVWYDDRLQPLVYAVAALGESLRRRPRPVQPTPIQTAAI